MRRSLYEADHEAFRDTVRTFAARHLIPSQAEHEAAGVVDRSVWLEAGKQGLLGFAAPEEHGGADVRDFRFNSILSEEFVSVADAGLGLTLHNDIVLPYITELGTEEQKARWLPGMCSGDIVSAVAMTEPGAGSDLQGMTTNARRDGGDFVLNGAKTFITNGISSDIVVVATRTNPDVKASRGMSLLVVERGMPGFNRGRKLHKVGMKAQDTAELFFDDVRVPAENLLGQLDGGFGHLMAMLPQERLSITVGAVAGARFIHTETLEYCKTRKAFGTTIGSFQNTQFELAEMATELEIAEHYVDRCVLEHNAGRLSAVDAAMGKLWTTELQKRVVDRCLQLHGGYGYMLEYPVAKAFLDSRVQTIYGGTSEIMKQIIAKSLGL